MKSFFYSRLFPLTCVCIACIVLYRVFAGGGAAPPRFGMEKQPVRVAKALVQDVPEYLSGLGTVLPSADALVRSRVDGELVRLHFTEGQHVQAGDLLAEIDPRPFEAALAEARGTLAKDKALLEDARLDLGRYLKLSRNKYIAGQEYTAQQAKVLQYEGIVAADEAKVRSAELQLEYSRITAPVSGRTGLRQVEPGNMVHASDTKGIVRISEIQPCYVVFTLSETKLDTILQGAIQNGGEKGMETQAWDRDRRSCLAAGRLLSMDNTIDTATGTVKLKAEFENSERRLFPNQFVNARLLARTFAGALTVPAAAVQLGMNGSYIFTVQNGTVHMADVTTAYNDDRIAVVTKGIKPGDTVVVDGVDRLREGSPVEVVAEIETPRASDRDSAAAPEAGTDSAKDSAEPADSPARERAHSKQ